MPSRLNRYRLWSTLVVLAAVVLAQVPVPAAELPAAEGLEKPLAAPNSAPRSTEPSGRPEDAAQPGTLQLERPTLICLGAHWPVRGDANKNTRIACHYRKAGTERWLQAQDLFRVDSAGLPQDIDKGWAPPAGVTEYAGSIFELHPDTEYELKFTLIDPDGGGVEKILKQRTRPVPQAAADGRQLHVVPGNGGGKGTAEAPFKGLGAAQAAAQPGDIFLLHKGTYAGTFKIEKNGEPGKPIVWRGAGDGETILDGQGSAKKWPGRTIDGTDCHDIFFENLTIINAEFAVVCHRSQRIVMRGCHITKTNACFTATVNPENGVMTDFYIADNLMAGPSTWPRTKGIEDIEGIQIGGEGHVCCYNTIRGFGDALSTYQHTHSCAIDFYGNDISEQTDDGIEMDYSLRNTRCFRNRLTNVFQGISVQPVYGGPVYIFRNALLNVEVEPFKIHNSPSGAVMLHNTIVKPGEPLLVMTSAPMNNILFRNNLFIGTTSEFAMLMDLPIVRCDFDYDGYGGTWKMFQKWHKERAEALSEKLPAEKHGVVIQPASCFETKLLPPADPKKQADWKKNDLRLAEKSDAIDRGIAMPNVNDGFGGKAPDLGAYERGQPLPWYGARKPGDSHEESVWPAPAAPAPAGP